jgi:hypothetical protein
MPYEHFISRMTNKEIINERKKIGRTLLIKRKQKNITHSKLCKITGLSNTILLFIERGSANYTIDSYNRYIDGIRKAGCNIKRLNLY